MVNPADEQRLRELVKNAGKPFGEITEEISGLDKRLDLSGANLNGFAFYATVVPPTNFSRASLVNSVFFSSLVVFPDFSNANLSRASMNYATLLWAGLSGTNFSEADLRNTTLLLPTLADADFSGARISETVFTGCDFSRVKGLSQVKHEGPCQIDISTLTKTFDGSGDRFSNEVQSFFINAGVPRELVDAIPKIVGKTKHYTCFVCYGSPDKDFALKLRKDLDSRGVTSWLYALDATVGEPTWHEISQRRRESERMILICSARALVREGVLKEIEEQIDDNPDAILPISVDSLWKEPGFPVKRSGRDLKEFLLRKNYADFANEPYEKALADVLKALEKKPVA